jgi:hypothetical protein
VHEQNGINHLLLYPNPASTVLNIQNPESVKTKIQLYNMPGELIGSYEMQSATMQLDISRLASGMYFLVAETAQGRTVSKVQIAH